MNHAALVNGFKHVEHGGHDACGLVRSGVPAIGKPAVEGQPRRRLDRDIRHAVGLARIVDLQDAAHPAETGRNPLFVGEAGGGFGKPGLVHLLRESRLDEDLHTRVQVARREDHPAIGAIGLFEDGEPAERVERRRRRDSRSQHRDGGRGQQRAPHRPASCCVYHSRICSPFQCSTPGILPMRA